MDVGSTSKIIKRIRTFKDDIAIARTEAKTTLVHPTEVGQNTKQAVTDAVVYKTPIQKALEHKTLKSETLEHEFEKVKAIQKASILSDEATIYNNSDSFESGTIIRDTKQSKFALFNAVGKAVGASLTEAVEDYKEKHKKPTVESAVLRKEVIEKAASIAEHAPIEDFTEVAQRLKETERKPIEIGISFKAKEEVPKPTWSYITQTAEPTQEQEVERAVILQEPDEQTVSHIKKLPHSNQILDELPKVTANAVEQEKLIEHEVEREQVIDEALQTIFEDKKLADKEHLVAQKEYIPILAPKTRADTFGVSRSQALGDAQRNYLPTTPFRTDSVIEKKTNNKSVAPVVLKNTMVRVVIFLGVIVATSVLGVLTSYYFFGKEQPAVTVAYDIPIFIQTEETKTIPLPPTAERFLQEIKIIGSQTPGVSHIYPLMTIQETQRPASTEVVVAVLQNVMPSSIARTTKALMFGSINGEHQYMVIQGTNFDTLFAGMLEWENTIGEDLAPLFNSAGLSQYVFIDIIANNRNMRVLRDNEGNDQLLYAFINQNTLIITTHGTAMETLLQRLK